MQSFKSPEPKQVQSMIKTILKDTNILQESLMQATSSADAEYNEQFVVEANSTVNRPHLNDLMQITKDFEE